MSELKENEYQCAECNQVFQYEWSDEEARAEAAENGLDPDICDIVCDDCYKRIWPRACED
ncbi:MAG: hypothetical protein OEX12_05825 [Gammaproteobacteria bacterium]|nr:hypothetical protein [Gammaproteobacteria bacterium]